MGGDAADGAGTAAARDVQQALAADVLARQAQFGLQWLAEGVVAFEVPVRLPSGDARATLRVRRDRDTGRETGDAPAFSVTFRVTSPMFGIVDTRASWRGGALSATISVERESTRAWLEPELASLVDALRGTFPRVTADLKVDPRRAQEPVDAPPLPNLPAGSIVSVRA
jgi:hypothetical protein